MKFVVVVIALSLSVPSLAGPTTEKWEMVVTVTDDTSTDSNTPLPHGADVTTDRSHTTAHVNVVVEATPDGGNVQSGKLLTISGGGTVSSTHQRRYSTWSMQSNQGEKPHKVTETIEEDFATSGTIDPTKTTTDEVTFLVGDAITVNGTLHAPQTVHKNHSKKTITSEGSKPIVHTDDNSITQDDTVSFVIPIAQATKAMIGSRRYTATNVEQITDKRMLAMGTKGTTTTTVDIHPLGKLELIVQPKDETAFEAWLPLPDVAEGGDKQLFGEPKPIPVRIVVHDTSQGTASGKAVVPANSATSCDIEVQIVDVSKHEGVTMNYPAGAGDGKPDLFFPKTGQPTGAVIAADGQKLNVAHARELVVMVAARDAGAYGGVQATCKDQPLTSRDPRTNDSKLALPMDDNHNRVGDEWERTYGIYGSNYAADWDAEDVPKNDTKGDGLTLFEEYRGVIDADDKGVEHFHRLDPRHWKLFVRLAEGPDVALWRAGVAMFQKATKIEVRLIGKPDRLQPLDGARHWLNFHKTAYTTAKQCAVIIEDVDPTTTEPAYTKPIDGYPDTQPSTPATTNYINISNRATAQQIENWINWFPPADVPTTFQAGADAAHIDLTKVTRDQLHAKAAGLVRLLIAWETMHELGHATGGRHHDVDAYVEFGDRIVAKDGGDYRKWPKDVKDAFNTSKENWFGGGDHACPMRYWNDGPVKTDLAKFLVANWDLNLPADGGAWKFCDKDWPNMRVKPR